MPLRTFHPLTRRWFTQRFGQATEVQALSWPVIQGGSDCLIAAPTGSGKTLTAFLNAIDRLLRDAIDGSLTEETRIVYVSPLKALSNDIRRNLEAPLAELEAAAVEAGMSLPKLHAAVRTGDTTSYQRQKMLKHPPHILVTTPESLYNMLTSEKSRAILRRVDTVIVDEIHALARDKRGSHLSLSLARLDQLITTSGQRKPTRIGLSATQKPLDEIAAFLVGQDSTGVLGPRPYTIIDTGHKKELDLGVEVPKSELGAVCSNEQWEEVYEHLKELVETHRSTLIFVNTRKLAERVAFHLTAHMGEDAIASHHGSMSKEKRLSAEERLKSGALKAIVATGSLELGIDVGYIDLVCQIGSPRSIAAFLQRIGRSGHAVGAKPKGRLFALTRDELIEAMALIKAVRSGDLDRIEIPAAPLDILSQQIVAMCAVEGWHEDALYGLCRQAYPYRNLLRTDFDQVLDMLAVGYAQGRKRSAYLHRDRIAGTLKARPHARLSAVTSGGAIPEQGEFRVLTEGDASFVGTLNEDFAIESAAGDVFLLGNTSWQIVAVRGGEVTVRDAHGAPPTVPFWLGEAPGRTIELSTQLGHLREALAMRVHVDTSSGTEVLNDPLLSQAPLTQIAALNSPAYANALLYLRDEVGTNDWANVQAVHYIAVQKAAIGLVPTQKKVVFERFFDESGGMQLVIHAPFGMRINKGWGLALRKRFCRSFDFELQASADNDGIVLSLGPQHSFPIESLFKMLNEDTIEPLLEQAILQVPLFQLRWRWNATRSLAVLRQKSGKRVPPALQRFRSDDLLTAVFPAQTQCQEHITGDIELPDHPLIKQTMNDCMREAIDIDGLKQLIAKLRSGEIELIARDTREPSPFAYQLLNAYPYAFLDGAPLEERRARAVAMRRSLSIDDMRDLGRLDPNALEQVRHDAWPLARNIDELHDVLAQIPALPEAEIDETWHKLLADLQQKGRAFRFVSTSQTPLWACLENLPLIRAAYPALASLDHPPLPAHLERNWDQEDALLTLVRGYVECKGVITASAVAKALCLPEALVQASLQAIESRGAVLRGRFSTESTETEWCERRLLMRIHKLTLEGLRRQIRPVRPEEFFLFLCKHQRLSHAHRAEGKQGLLEVILQLQGLDCAAGAWETEILATRIKEYQAAWLDELMQTGIVSFGRLASRNALSPNGDLIDAGEASAPKSSGVGMSRVAPLSLLLRENLAWLLPEHARVERSETVKSLRSVAAAVYECLATHGAQFMSEIKRRSRLLDTQVEEALGELCRLGLVHADGFAAVRPFVSRNKKAMSSTLARRGLPARFQLQASYGGGGRWAVFPPEDEAVSSRDERLEAWADLLLHRYGVVFRDLLVRETAAPSWGELVPILRQREARGELRGGRFVAPAAGEQYALPEAVEALRQTRDTMRHDAKECVLISAADPLNLFGILLPGPRIPTNRSVHLAVIAGQLVATRDNDSTQVHVALPPHTEQRIRDAMQLSGAFRSRSNHAELRDCDLGEALEALVFCVQS